MSNVKFVTQYSYKHGEASEAGCGEVITYRTRYSESGEMELYEYGREDLYEYIQSHADSVNIMTLINRHAKGDATALSKVQGVYGDFSSMPKTLIEMINVINDGKRDFDSMSAAQKALFGNSFEQYAAGVMQDDIKQDSEMVSAAAPIGQPASENMKVDGGNIANVDS